MQSVLAAVGRCGGHVVRAGRRQRVERAAVAELARYASVDAVAATHNAVVCFRRPRHRGLCPRLVSHRRGSHGSPDPLPPPTLRRTLPAMRSPTHAGNEPVCACSSSILLQVSGDCANKIHLWQPNAAGGWVVDPIPMSTCVCRHKPSSLGAMQPPRCISARIDSVLLWLRHVRRASLASVRRSVPTVCMVGRLLALPAGTPALWRTCSGARLKKPYLRRAPPTRPCASGISAPRRRRPSRQPTRPFA